MALTAILGFKEGCTILSYDGANAFNSIYRNRFLPTLAEIVPSVVPYALDLYARDPPNLVEDLAAFATLVVSSRVLPQVFWALHTRANLFELGQKSRPVACGDVLRRVIDAVFCSRYGRKLADYIQPWDQCGVAVSGRVEIMALTAILGFKEGCTILSYDETNSFNSIYHHRFLPAIAEIVPPVVPYALDLYVREPPKLVEDLAAFTTLVVSSGVLPQVFWALHTSANLSALGEKSKPLACGDVLRRVIGTVICRQYGRKLSDYFQPCGQYGVAVSGRVEIMAFIATLCFIKECCTILSYDGANAFNSIYRHRFLPALAKIIPSLVPCARDHSSAFIPLSLSLSLCLSLSRGLSRYSQGLRPTWCPGTETGPLSAYCCMTRPAQICMCVCMWGVYICVCVCVCVCVYLLNCT